MCIERCEGNCASEVGFLPLRHRLLLIVQVLLSESKVDYEHLLVVS